jgi:hypothetical protein
MTCGWQRNEYGSCTRVQSTCEARIALPAIRSGIRAPPRSGRVGRALVDAVIERRIAALERIDRHGAGDDGAANTSSAPNSPASASAVETCVPLISASPFLGAQLERRSPAKRKPSAAGSTRPLTRTWPMPSSTALRCASGARSPEAPTEPCAGITG